MCIRDSGYIVSGSDARRSETTDRLAELGVRVAIGHDAVHIGDADVVVTSSAASDVYKRQRQDHHHVDGGAAA